MSDFRRRLMSKLNNDYTKLNYIESTGTQYIDTGYIPNMSTRLSIDYLMYTRNSRYQEFIGSRSEDNSADTFSLRQRSEEAKINLQRADKGTSYVIDADLNTAYRINISPTTFTVNETSIEGPVVQDGIYPLFLFAGNLNGSAWRKSYVRMGRITIRDNSGLVLDFIPVLDKNKVPCMYDLVKKEFHYNEGTGSFLYEGGYSI